MKIKYLTYNQVLDAYRELINKFGGFGAIRDNNALLSVIANPQREFNGKDLYPTLASKATILVYSLIKSHPFVDGNKRIAFTIGRLFLRLNGYDVTSTEGYYSLILKIARSEASKEDVSEWFEFSIETLSSLAMAKKEKIK